MPVKLDRLHGCEAGIRCWSSRADVWLLLASPWRCIVTRQNGRIAERRRSYDNHPMVAASLISARVTAAKKARFAAVAHHQGFSESALLERLVDAALLASEVVHLDVADPVEHVATTGKISVQLRLDELLLLRERVKGRAVPTATYISFLIRSHLRSLAPLLTQELAALKASLAELGQSVATSIRSPTR